MKKFEGTYRCKMHGLFSLVMADAPPAFIQCPDCSMNSPLMTVTCKMGTVDLETMRKMIEALKGPNILKFLPGEPTPEGIEYKVKNPPEPIKESVMILHEARERELMREAIETTKS